MQIARLMQEKKAKDDLENHIEQIRKITSRFEDKEKNLNYYSAIGKALSFFKNDNFKNIKPYSIFRRIVDEIPGILFGLDAKRIQDHLMMMYRIGELDKSILSKASWDQWYEIVKFKSVHKKQKLLKKILKECKSAGAGPSLRKKIKILLAKKE